MRIIVIPDVHLKPFLFTRTAEILKRKQADRAVCLMDIADDWNKQYRIEEYACTYDAAIDFAKRFPETLWCYGNHDLCYVLDQRETGYSQAARYTVLKKLNVLQDVLGDNQIRFVQKVDNVLFSHGGVSEYFVERNIPNLSKTTDLDYTVETINALDPMEMWRDDSPIWMRPQYGGRMYRESDVLQVVGHTPVKSNYRDGSVISTDTFSTYSDLTPIGNAKQLLIDTDTWEFEEI